MLVDKKKTPDITANMSSGVTAAAAQEAGGPDESADDDLAARNLHERLMTSGHESLDQSMHIINLATRIIMATVSKKTSQGVFTTGIRPQ